ncbi:hypothetical protein QQ045_026688 [Rhodiola kirilowii]
MGLSWMTTRRVVVLIVFIFVLNPAYAMRPLNQVLIKPASTDHVKYKSLLITNVLQRGPVPPSGPSPCTFIPGQGSGSCPTATAATLNGKNFAGHTFPTHKAAIVAHNHAEA